MPHALVLDDHADSRSALAALATGEGFSVDEAGSLEAARRALARQVPDIVLADLRLPDGNGLSLLDDLQSTPDTAVVLVTGYASLDTAVEALRRGVTDYLTKPVDLERLKAILSDVGRTSGITRDIHALRAQLDTDGRFGRLVGISRPMRHTYDLIARIAPTSAAVIITGPSGTGKELVARTIHDLSRRRRGPFVAINCGAISPSLMESEIFGHERGAFTGAQRRHRGCFERAHRGTLLLDEITELPVELQVKLLRVLESHTFVRVGGETPLPADVRVLAATNSRIEDALAERRLREDLYFRLKVFQLYLPPLRDRAEDIERLARHFLAELEQAEGTAKRLSDRALVALQEYAWPGNVRELRNVMYSAFVLAEEVVDLECLPPEVRRGESDVKVVDDSSLRIPIGTPIAEVERRMIVATLERFKDNKTRTAEALGISLKTLYNRLKSYDAPKASVRE